MSHALIDMNRIFPISCRNHHTKKAAILICVGMSVYVHAMILTGFNRDGLVFRESFELFGCRLYAAAQRV